VSVVGAESADQRSSKLAGAMFASTVEPFNMVLAAESIVASVQCRCDLMVAAVAATASRATARNPVIVRCLVIRTSVVLKAPLAWVRRNFAEVQQQCFNYD
jgi:hypothetical protein